MLRTQANWLRHTQYRPLVPRHNVDMRSALHEF